MNILIIEDEKRNFNRLKRLLEGIDLTFRIDGPTTSVIETIEHLTHHAVPDLILADIRLTDGLSFDAFSQVSVPSPIIFTTAYDEYALRAFKYNSIDYLMKPIDPEELMAAIEKVRRLPSAFPSDDTLRQLMEQLRRSSYKYRERFLLPWRDGYKSVLVRDINHICSEDRTTRIYLNNGTSEAIPLSMESLEGQLNPDLFFRANRQYFIHIDHVLYIGNYFNSKLLVRLKGYPQKEIIIGRDKAPSFKEWMNR